MTMGCLGMVGIAQLVEQRTENPRVTSSNLVPDTWLICMRSFFYKLIDMKRDTY